MLLLQVVESGEVPVLHQAQITPTGGKGRYSIGPYGRIKKFK